MLRARRSNDPDALICFNLLPQETTEEAPTVPGRVSETRLMLVEYWRRDQRAAAIEASRAATAPYGDLPSSTIFVNGAPVSPNFPPAGSEPFAAAPPAPEMPPPVPIPVQEPAPPTLDPNRVDFLSSLKSKRPPTPPPAASANGPLIIELPSSSEFSPAPREPAQPAASSALFADAPPPAPAPAPERARSIFEPRPREVAPSRSESPSQSVFAKAFGDIPDVPAEFFKEEPPVANTARQVKIDALQAFLARVEHRRRQIESQSVA